MIKFLILIKLSFILLVSNFDVSFTKKDPAEGELSAGKDPISGACPPSTFTDTWLFHNETNKCFLADRRGPCGEMMIYYQDPENPKSGFCDCDDSIREKEREELPDYCNWKRPRIYWPPAKRCFSAFHRGPCQLGQWLVMDGSSPVCETNLCNPQAKNEDPDDMYFSFTYKERCYKTFTYGYCKNKKFLVLNSDESWCPMCSKSPNKRFKVSDERDEIPDIIQVTCPDPKQCNALQLGCREGRKTHINLEGICEDYADSSEDWK